MKDIFDLADVAMVRAHDRKIAEATEAFRALGCGVEPANDPSCDLIVFAPNGEEYTASAHDWREVLADIAYEMEQP